MFTARRRGPGPVAAGGAAILILAAGVLTVVTSTKSDARPSTAAIVTLQEPDETASPSEPAATSAEPTIADDAANSPTDDPAAPADAVTAGPRPAVDLTVELPLGVDDDLVAAVVAATVQSPELARRIDTLGIALRDAEGRDVYDLRAHQPFLPASTQKLVTAAAALRILGPDHRFETQARADVDPDGVVAGDLFVVGGGDPTLTTEQYRTFVFPSRPATSLEALADRIVAAGVTTINGGVVGDGTRFVGPTMPAGWKQEYIDDQDGSQITALTVDAGIDLIVEPREGQGPQLTITTGIDPVLSTATALTRLLRDRGVVVRATPRSITAPSPARQVIATVESPTVREIMTFAVQRSDNHLADTVFRSLATPQRTGTTWIEAASAASKVLEGLGIDMTGVRIVDGSGLSRNDRITADALAELDVVMRATDGEWAPLQAVMGRTGTLRRRLRGSLAEGRVRGKTGTLDDVKAVELSIENFDGTPRFHLAVIGNAREDRFVVQVLMDELVLRLIEQVEGCTRVPTGDAPAATEPPIVVPYQLACPPGVTVKPPDPVPTETDTTGLDPSTEESP